MNKIAKFCKTNADLSNIFWGLDSIYEFSVLFCSNSSPILELSDKFASQICHENINKPLDGAYLADFGMDIRP